MTKKSREGTYDYAPPYDEQGKSSVGRFAEHVKKDMFDWFLYGN